VVQECFRRPEVMIGQPAQEGLGREALGCIHGSINQERDLLESLFSALRGPVRTGLKPENR
jgi:hypothetical protein